MLARQQAEAARRGDGKVLRPSVTKLLREASIVLGNLEAPLASSAKPNRPTAFRAPPEALAVLRHFTLVSLANNHIHDCGDGGIAETLDALASAGVLTAGVCPRGEDPYAPVIIERHGHRVAVFACAGDPIPDLPGSSDFVMARVDDARLTSSIRQARSVADSIIVLHHGGIEYVPFPPPETRERLRQLTAAGAHAVFTHHPHVVGGMERGHADAIIWHSLGDFVFDSLVPQRRIGCVVLLDLDSRPFEPTIVPTLLGEDLTVDYAPAQVAEVTRNRVARLSACLDSPRYRRLYPFRHRASFYWYQFSRLAHLYRHRGFAEATRFAGKGIRLLVARIARNSRRLGFWRS